MEKLEETKNILPQTNRTCKLVLTAPITTALNERSFSKIKIIKQVLRSNMADERLNSLMLLGIKKDLTVCLELDGIVEKWSMLKQRSCSNFCRYSN